MFFLNLTMGEFVVLFAALSGLITALYLLDRSKSTKIVSTLRFWTSDAAAASRKTRKRIREPWSFLLQILSILLLLLAIGQLQWGNRERPSRKHVLLIDTSAWSSELMNGGTVLDAEKRIALQYLARLPTTDQVLPAGVDAFTSPATLFTSDRAELSKAIEKLQPSYSALNIVRALSFAQKAEPEASTDRAARSNVGGLMPYRSLATLHDEVVYIGPGRILKTGDTPPILRDLRVILVRANEENCGIRNLGLRRDDQNPNLWHAAVTIENYGKQAHAVQLASEFPGRLVASRSLTIEPYETTTLEYSFLQAKEGRLTTSIEPDFKSDDALRADDRVTLPVPGSNRTRLAVFTNRPDILKPLIRSDENLEAAFFTPEQYNSHPAADAMVLDRTSPAAQPEIPAIWIEPPRDSSPVPVEAMASDAVIDTRNTADNIDVNFQGKNTELKSAEVFRTQEGDSNVTIARIGQGPVIVAHPSSGNHPGFVVLGIDPLQGELRFQAAAPLLLASVLRWLCPRSEQVSGVNTSFVGVTGVSLSSDEQKNVVSVTDGRGTPVPFDVHGPLLEFFTDRPSPIRIQSRSGASRILPLLADVADDVWTPPADSNKGLPPSRIALPSAFDLWKWLALAGGVGLLADWLLFGRKRRIAVSQARKSMEQDRELVQR